MKIKEENKRKFNIEARYKWVLWVALSLILFSLFAPFLLTQYSFLDLTKKGEIGDTIGGTMAPFIGLAGVILTFIAFYVQYEANIAQRAQFQEQLKEDKKQFHEQLEEQKATQRINQFESKFYELIRLHKENVNEFSLSVITKSSYGMEQSFRVEEIKGRNTFSYLLDELSVIYSIGVKNRVDISSKDLLHRAYSILFHGLKPLDHYQDKSQTLIQFHKHLDGLNQELSNQLPTYHAYFIKDYSGLDTIKFMHSSFVSGKSSMLGHYFRHLYQCVKFVVEQDEAFLCYQTKREYLKILRAQLSNHEQALLFYNWLADFGGNWESDDNKFFSDYRMIHNLDQELILSDFNLTDIFNLNSKPTYRKLSGKADDFLFEFQG